MIDRPITWVDIFYIAAVAATEDKMAMISRYPIKELWHYKSNLVMKIA